jgi:hypothetical protein
MKTKACSMPIPEPRNHPLDRALHASTRLPGSLPKQGSGFHLALAASLEEWGILFRQL